MVVILLSKKTIYKTFLFSFMGFGSIFYLNNCEISAHAMESVSSINVTNENKELYNVNINSLNINSLENVESTTNNKLKIEGIENIGINISDDITYIYKEKNVMSEKIAVLPKNGVCDIIPEENLTNLDNFLKQDSEDFILVKSGDFEGYVLSRDIDTNVQNNDFTYQTYAITLSDTSYYKEIDNQIQETENIIPIDTILEVLGYSNDNKYIKTNYDNKEVLLKTSVLNIKPFVNYAYEYETNSTYKKPNLSFNTREEFETSLIEFATQFIGNKYVWGGTSLINGVDCSGFTQAIYRKFGYELDRCAVDQINDGIRINENELEIGDLVFYSDGSKISHVAMYIGNGNIIHASNSKPYPQGGIKISPYNYQTPVGYVRIVNDKF